MQLVVAGLDDAEAGLRHLVPGAGQVAERLGDHEPGLVGELVQHRVLGVQLPQRGDVGAVEQRPRLPFARVAERPEPLAVGRRHRHLDRVLDAVAARRPPRRARPRARRRRAGRPPGRTSAPGRTCISESVEPSIVGKSDGSTASTRSRLTLWKSRISPLCIHSQRPWRNGWQLVCCTGEPVEARMWAKNSGALTLAASSRRLRSFQAGSMLGTPPGSSAARRTSRCRSRRRWSSSAPIRECRLWIDQRVLRACRAGPPGGPASPSMRASGTSWTASKRGAAVIRITRTG